MTHAFQLQISLPLICRLVVLKMWEPKLLYHPVTLRSHGYGDITATYICRAEIPLHIYIKDQYRQESECRNTVVIYIPTKKYKYIVITESDTILQEYYITRAYKSMIYREIFIIKSWEVLTSSKKSLEHQSVGPKAYHSSFDDDQLM